MKSQLILVLTAFLTACSGGLKPQSSCFPNRATLTWDRLSAAGGGIDTSVLGYRIYYRREPPAVASMVDVPVNDFTSPEVSHSITDFEPETYYFSVSAYNANGEGPRSDEVAHTFTGCGQSYYLRSN